MPVFGNGVVEVDLGNCSPGSGYIAPDSRRSAAFCSFKPQNHLLNPQPLPVYHHCAWDGTTFSLLAHRFCHGA